MNTSVVLVTGGRAPATLELIRSLGKQGHRIIVAESFPFHLSKASRYVFKHYDLPSPCKEYERFVSELENIIRAEQVELLIPTCEEIFYIAKAKQHLSKHCRVFVDQFDKLITLHNKYEFIKLAEHVGLVVPKTFLVESTEQLERLADKERPAILKPVYSRFSTSVRKLSGDESLPPLDITPAFPWVYQHYIEGKQYCSYSVAYEGKLLLHSVYETEWTAGGGASITFAPVESEQIKKWVETFVAAYHFSGQIAFDFIKQGEALFAIECNPRLTSGIHLFRGVDISSAFLQSYGQKLIQPNPEKQVALTLAMVLELSKLRTWKQWKEWLAVMQDAEDGVYERGDWRPVSYQFVSYFHLWRKARRLKISILEATTEDIQWDGDAT
ncbi:ATP-grasp domain-containing protein [Bacillus tianshenii]|nr:ATP-grasp domain-containing protein [Bacillus tianshenii]